MRIRGFKDKEIFFKCGSILLTYKNVKLFSLVFLITVLLTFLHIKSTNSNNDVAKEVWKGAIRGSSTKSSVSSDSKLRYGIVVDCGSSGSRVYVYCWPPHHGGATELLNIQQLRDNSGQLVMKKIEPGLSELKDTPSQASSYLRPLLDYASGHVPQEKHKETPLYIMATAGLRMLSESEQEAILSNLRLEVALHFDFLFSETHVEVISGKQEGVYAWVAINYVLRNFDHSSSDEVKVEVKQPGSGEGASHYRKRTVGMIDMGGGSVQIAFEIPNTEDVGHGYSAELNLGCSERDASHVYRIYVATFLGFGGNVARTRYEHLRVDEAMKRRDNDSDVVGETRAVSFEKPNSVIRDPCLPVNMSQTVEFQGRMFRFTGTGNFERCARAQLPLLNKTSGCDVTCSLNGAHQPRVSERMQFFGFSEFFYSMEDVLYMAGHYNFRSFARAAQEFCADDWNDMWLDFKAGKYPKADERRFKMQCFKSAWISTVLHDGFGFSRDTDRFTSTQLVHGQDMQWTLGALVYKTRYFPLRDIERHSSVLGQRVKQHRGWFSWTWSDSEGAKHSDWSSSGWWVAASNSTVFSALLSLCVVVVLVAALVYIRRLFCARKSSAALLPTLTHADVMRRSVTMGQIGAIDADVDQRRLLRTPHHQTHNRAASFSIAPPNSNYYR